MCSCMYGVLLSRNVGVHTPVWACQVFRLRRVEKCVVGVCVYVGVLVCWWLLYMVC